jgi:hypothetical protein
VISPASCGRSGLLAGLALLALFASARTWAVLLDRLQGEHAQALYGRYAVRGDCRRTPRITVDDAGMLFEADGLRERSRRFVHALTFMGQQYHGISQWFFPFARSEDDYGWLLMTFNADEQRGKLSIDAPSQQRAGLSPLQAALVRHSPYWHCGPLPALPSQPPATPATPVAVLDWNSLPAMLGKYLFEFDLFDAGNIAGQLRQMLGRRLAVLRKNLDVSGPLQREGTVYYLSGNAPHLGGTDQAYILLDVSRHAIQVGLWQRGSLRVWVAPGPRIALPAELRQLLAQSPPEHAVAMAPRRRWHAGGDRAGRRLARHPQPQLVLHARSGPACSATGATTRTRTADPQLGFPRSGGEHLDAGCATQVVAR